MFDAIFYITQDDANVLNKRLEQKFTRQIQLKEDSDIEEPVFIVKADGFNLLCNYMRVTNVSLAHDYWYIINNKKMVTGGRLELECTSDPLQILKSQLLDIPLLIERQEFVYNNWIEDPMVEVQSDNQLVVTQAIGSLSKDNRYYITVTGSIPPEPTKSALSIE